MSLDLVLGVTQALALTMSVAFVTYVFVIVVPYLRRKPAPLGEPSSLEWHFFVPCRDEEAVIGDTIRYSLTADPVEEAKAGRQLLENLGLRERKGLDLIACPSCGRAEVDVIDVATRAQAALEAENLPIQVAVMGCVVNGPGEAREADIGIAAGRGRGHLFIKGQVVRVVPESEMVEALLDEARKLVAEGVESRLAHAEANAADIAAAAREELIQIQGDANRSQDRRARVAEVAGSE